PHRSGRKGRDLEGWNPHANLRRSRRQELRGKAAPRVDPGSTLDSLPQRTNEKATRPSRGSGTLPQRSLLRQDVRGLLEGRGPEEAYKSSLVAEIRRRLRSDHGRERRRGPIARDFRRA